jgi:hypothetical protein
MERPDERHGRWAGLATWEECLAGERGGSSRDTIRIPPVRQTIRREKR